jgi:hypothetical protein
MKSFISNLGITIMLLATTVMLLVFRSPSATISVLWLISAKMFINDKAPFPLRKFHSIANLCATLNAATTFIMFMIYGKKFRSEFTRIYCCCFEKLKREKSKIITNKQEQQLIPNNDEQHIQNQINLLSNRKTRHSSGTTISTSVGSLRSLKCFRNQQRKARYTLDQQCNGFNNTENINQQQQHELTIREDECINLNNDTKSVTVPDSYSNWFKNFIFCR